MLIYNIDVKCPDIPKISINWPVKYYCLISSSLQIEANHSTVQIIFFSALDVKPSVFLFSRVAHFDFSVHANIQTSHHDIN